MRSVPDALDAKTEPHEPAARVALRFDAAKSFERATVLRSHHDPVALQAIHDRMGIGLLENALVFQLVIEI